MKSAVQTSGRFRFWLRKHFLRIAISLLITAMFILDTTGKLPLPLMDRFENIIYDTRVKMTAPGDIDNRIVIIDIDEKSLLSEGHWPWSRIKLARLLDNLFNEYGIALLAIDMVFAERDDNEILAQLDMKIAQENSEQLVQTLTELRSNLDTDHIFAESIKERPVILGYYFTHEESDRIIKGKLPEPAVKKEEFDAFQAAYIEASGYGANIDILQSHASGAGFFDNPTADNDGVFRRLPIVQTYENELYEALASLI